MDFAKFLKKHYEKVLLSIILAALAVAAVFLLLRVSVERQELEQKREMSFQAGSRALPTIDLSTNQSVLKRLRQPEPVQLAGKHNLFNPVTWQKQGENLIKIVTGKEIGPGALTITKVTPLMLRVEYLGLRERGSRTSHRFRVTREAESKVSDRSPKTLEFQGAGARNEPFILRELLPNAEAPTAFVLEMTDKSGKEDQIDVQTDQPYAGVAGHMADLRYEPERLTFKSKRLGDRLVFAGDTNRIVSIETNSVTVEAVSNRKRTTILVSEETATDAQ